MTTSTGPLTVPPFRLEPAYADRDAVWCTLIDHAPYALMSAGSGYDQMMKFAPIMPWFRKSWIVGGKSNDADIEALIDDPQFIKAAGRLFDAKVVRPQSVTVNVMAPMDAGARHFDTPAYRGLPPATTPIWLPMNMGVSGLFDRWAIRVAGILTWFYDGTDGEYEYWPQGLHQPSESVRGPFGNMAIVGDNDLMFHQVGAFGDIEKFQEDFQLTPQSKIQPASEGWEITDGTNVIGSLPSDQVRVSILWRAETFQDESDASVFDDHDDDLDLDKVVSIFSKDLKDRGISFKTPDDPLHDDAWSALLAENYLMKSFMYQA
jgi:hypothetical protein